jgi:hypothetical protein
MQVQRKMPQSSGNSFLDSNKIIGTIDRLRLRISERFPDSGLLKVSETCLTIAQHARERAEFIDRPIYWLRAVIWLIVLALVMGIGLVTIFLPRHLLDFTENWETIEAVTSETLLLSAGLFFLVSLERRFKRQRALSAIHELRAVAHVIDMHQLTKDPERLLTSWKSSEHSPVMTMTAFELGRYLDYCSELLSLIGKIAAIYVQRFDDEVALEAVNEVELLTNSLCSRIWQKTMALNSMEGLIANRPAPALGTDSHPDASASDQSNDKPTTTPPTELR